jgi:hypothetical protein
MSLPRKGQILMNTRTGRYEVAISANLVFQSQKFYDLTTRKVRKDGVSWGNKEHHVVTLSQPLPWRYVVVPVGSEPSALSKWRG